MKINRKIVAIILATILLIYNLYRAFVMSFSHDESISFFIITGNGAWWDHPNNHPLNTVLMWVTNHLFGSSEIALRLPNIIAGSLLVYFTHQLFKKSSSHIYTLGLCLICLNPYINDYFSLARGYGLSITALIAALHFLNLWLTTYTSKAYVCYSLSLGLALLANFTLIFPTLFIFLLTHFSTHKEIKRWESFNHLLFLMPLVFASLALSYFHINQLLYFGADINNIHEVLKSLMFSSIHHLNAPDYLITICTLLAEVILSFCLVISIKKYIKTRIISVTEIVSFATIATIFCLAGMNTFFDIAYPERRTGIYLIPMAIITVIYALETYQKSSKNKLVYVGSIVVAVLHFSSVVNFSHCIDTYGSQDAKQAYGQIQNDTERSVEVGAHWNFEPSLNYYRITDPNSKIQIVTRDSITRKEYEYYYITDAQWALLEPILKEGRIVKQYAESRTFLIARR